MIKRFIFSITVFIGVCAAPMAQVLLETRVDNSEVHFGDMFTYTIEVKYPTDYNVRFPMLGEGVEYLSVVNNSDAEVHRDAATGLWVRSRSYTVAVYQMQDFIIPPMAVLYTDPAGRTNILYTSTIPIHVITESTNNWTNMTLRDIKPPQRLPIDWTALYWTLGVFAVIGGLIYLIVFIINRFKKTKEEPVIPPKPEHEVAFAALTALAERGYVVDGNVKEYYSALCDILRAYIERRYSVVTMERTTDEIVEQLERAIIEQDKLRKSASMLTQFDLVKFAKLIPEENAYIRDWQSVYDFVDATKIIPEPEPAPEETAAAEQDTKPAGKKPAKKKNAKGGAA